MKILRPTVRHATRSEVDNLIELTRFQQLRPPQMIADEGAKQGRLPSYPDGKLSDFALSMQDAGNRQDYMALIQRYDEVNKQKPITELKAVNPVIAAFNQWLDFKARPIKLEDFKNFVATLQSRELLRPDDVWRNLADNLILSSERDLLHTRYCLQFQLLIRICYLIRLCLKIAEKGYKLRKGVTDREQDAERKRGDHFGRA